MEKVLTLCEAGADDRANYQELMANPGPLTAKMTRPDKAEAVKSFVSRFGKAVEPVGRPEGTEGVVVQERAVAQMEGKHTKKRRSQDCQAGETSSSSKHRK